MAKPIRIQKAIENAFTAEWCLENRYFSSACSRYYYYVYLHIVEIVNHRSHGIAVDLSSSNGSHLRTIEALKVDMIRRNKKDKLEALNIASSITTLKNYRTKADYSAELCDEPLANKAKALAANIHRYLTNNYLNI